MKNNPITALDRDLAKARSLVDKWATKETEARADVARLESTIGTTVVDDPTTVDRLTTELSKREREIRVYQSAKTEAEKRVTAVYAKHLDAEARDLTKAAKDAEKDAQAHDVKVDRLLAQLRDLDHVDYEPVDTEADGEALAKAHEAALDTMRKGIPAHVRSVTVVPRHRTLWHTVRDLTRQAEFARHVREHSTLPERQGYFLPGHDEPDPAPVTARVLADGIQFNA